MNNKMKLKNLTLTGKFIFILFLINLIGILFGITKVLTLGENTYYPSTTSSWYDFLLSLTFVFSYFSIVIMYYGYYFYSKKAGIINFFTIISFISLMLSGFYFYIVFSFGLLG
jgi:hypothetical protein